MIIIGGGDGAFVLVLFMFFLFFVLPFLLLRGARRAVAVPVDPRGGWTADPVPAPQPQSRWDVPQEPVLPDVAPAEVVSLRDRLGHDVRTLEPGADAVSRQAMADASERLSTCSTLLERADSQAQLRTAWLAAVEGLTATRLVRTRLGLDPGPEIPMPPTGPVLESPTRIDVGGRSHVGGPAYEPGRPHWFPGGAYGGQYVPGGWYDAPFWPSALILGGLGGLALGGLAGAMFADDVYGDGMYGGYGDGGFGGYGDGAYGDGGYGDGGYGGYGESGGGWGDAGGGWGDGGGGPVDSGGGWGDSGGGWGDGGGGGWDSGGGWGDGGGGWGDGGGGDGGGGGGD